MLGYITADTESLVVRDFRIYNGYYCGLCKAVGDAYPQILRTQLSYDLAFLACLLSSVTEEEELPHMERCIAHPIQKRPVIDCESVQYAADLMIILGYEKYLDDLRDRREAAANGTLSLKKTAKDEAEPVEEISDDEDLRFKDQQNASMALGHKMENAPWLRSAAVPSLKHAYRKACLNRPGEATQIHNDLTWLHALEHSKLGDPDLACECFSAVMQTIANGVRMPNGNRKKRILNELSVELGKWIYLVDALDDFEQDLEEGNYNPFIYKYGGPKAIGQKEKEAILEEGTVLLYHYLETTAADYELLDLTRNRKLLDNILYLGMRRRTDRVLDSLRAFCAGPKTEPKRVWELAEKDATDETRE